MPTKSKAQRNAMRMAANDKEAAKRLGIPQSVARKFVEADRRERERKRGSK
jgi:hypothetical protein